MIDLHTHLEYAQHGKGEVSELVAKAEELGLKYLGISDHFPLPAGFKDPAGDSAMKQELLSQYLKEINEASRNQRLNVLRGAEVDYIPKHSAEIQEAVSRLEDIDYLIGSVHFINGWNFDFSETVFNQGLRNAVSLGGDIDIVYEEYHALIRRMVELKLFDIVGHLDLPKKFGKHPEGDAGLNQTLDCIADNSMVLEINTSGNYKPVKEQYPSQEILEKAFKRAIPITIGSDAHQPDHVGRDIDLALQLASSVGYKNVAIFRNRSRIEIPITRLV